MNLGSTRTRRRASPQSENILVNALRAGAALMVVISHARILLLEDYDNVQHNLLQNAIYGLTSLGHEAVVLFFVLSGFWVGGSALRKIERSTFSWLSYLVDRLVRLWVVLIPVLMLTMGIGLVGYWLFPGFAMQAGGPYEGDSGAVGFVGNALFLGGIHVPTFGTNTPLWSLGFEFWMYILGPLLLLAFRATKGRIIYAVCAVVVATLVGPQVILYLPIWMVGVLIAYLQGWLEGAGSRLGSWLLTTIRASALFVTIGVAIAGRTVFDLQTWQSDFVLTVPVAILLASLIPGNPRRNIFSAPLERFSHLAHSSYSLYAIHMPILLLAVSGLGVGADERWASDVLHWFYLTLVVAGTVAVGWALGQVTEKHTNRVRDVVKEKLPLK